MNMFCFQCEQTVKVTGCTVNGACGKTSDTANLQDELINSIVKLACCNNKNDETVKLIVESLFTTVTNVNFDNDSIFSMIKKVRELIDCEESFDINSIWTRDEDIRSLKSLILFGIKGVAAYYYHSNILGYKNVEIEDFFFESLNAIAKNQDKDELLELVLKTGKINLICMELLDKANTQSYGSPVPIKVTTNIEKGPFIVVTGHDLKDLELLLEQTKDKGINIYTHGEMLPCHGYPKLKGYKHLKGNYGTAWQNQQNEFDNLPAPILFTTNCIMPVKDSYKDRVFTTSLVEYPNVIHIGKDKDFTQIINKAIELKGYSENKKMTGINGGDVLTVGYAHSSILSIADKIVNAIKEGKIKHIFLVGGCDGAKTGRNYYTEFVKRTPKDSIILTLACGKYRFNDMDLGEIDGIPRLLDLGQCNDAYSAIKIVMELSKVFNCSINELPLSLILSWYEQKAVCILLTLLYLGIKNIKLGPTLPAFISQNVLSILVDKYKISQITNADDDLEEILNNLSEKKFTIS